ncbi:dihydrofolate reductase family protein [Larkinella terrae]|uniref:Dihydrofolate reductase n=1 Tax=Larkinella terrae TaxID=2025311 RepID=A0A7K0ERC2_9BACT|nr:dihydrofolate reductase family protein [Larkinella terrae]MRS63968.1 dihydrofolate reductase [Larkinella terrae]
MRKVKLQVQISIDGFVATSTGEQYWMAWNWDDILKQYVSDIANSVDTMLIGRITYQGMANYWPSAATNPEATADELEFASKMNELTKVVFSNTLTTADWYNSRIATEPIEAEIARLKRQPGKDIIIYGGARIVSSLIKSGIIDEYHLFVNPVVLGTGMPIWNRISDRMNLRLINTTASSTGIVILCYQPEKNIS